MAASIVGVFGTVIPAITCVGTAEGYILNEIKYECFAEYFVSLKTPGCKVEEDGL